MRVARKLFTVFMLVVSGALIGCKSSPDSTAVINEVTENKREMMVSDLPAKFLDGFDTSSPSAIRGKLKTQDSLTLNGTTLTVGNVGGNTVTLACHKLKLINGARIVTNGNQLILYALEMEFNNSGGIDSFVGDTARASNDTAGSNAGGVEIHALDSVYGSLRIFLPGQIGGPGAPGEPGANGTVGTRGGDASDAFMSCGHGGGNGGKGNAGAPGHQGHPGKAGGNGGDLLLEGAASKSYDSLFPYQAPPGAGGPGGPGGAGGNGGPGGQGGSGSSFCGGGHGGDPGEPGVAGPPGDNGPSGTSSGKRSVK